MADSREQPIQTGETTFSSDSKLLAEIGERLISTADIALAELVKNAYDADATKCNIWLASSEETLIIKDDGHGMTEEEFLDYWMTIATTSRLEQETSRRFGRELTGAKGVGRFAVRNLGLELELETVAYHEEEDEYRRLEATFEWADFESGEGLGDEDITYRIYEASPEEEGTELRISDLQRDWSDEDLEEVTDELLHIVSAPYDQELSNAGQTVKNNKQMDPGFSVYFSPPGEGSPTESAAQEIYERYAARIEISVSGETLRYRTEYSYGYSDDKSDTRTYQFELDNNYVGNISGELRYFNNSYSLFRGMKTMDGRSVQKWLRNNGGVRVLDKGFRVPPYGDEGDDWLDITESHSRRERKWRSSFTSEFESAGSEIELTANDYQLNLPRKTQLLGHVSVSSQRPGEVETTSERPSELVPAMDREGFIENSAMKQLRDVARGAVEILGIVDREEKLRRKQRSVEEDGSKLKQKVKEKQKDLEGKIESTIGPSPDETSSQTLADLGGVSERRQQTGSPDETMKSRTRKKKSIERDSPEVDSESSSEVAVAELKQEIRESYEELESEVEEYQKSEEKLRTSVESMYLMSAVSAFMTHETSELLRHTKEMINAWESTPDQHRDSEFRNRLSKTKKTKEKLEKQLGYANRFMSGLDKGHKSKLSVEGKIREVIRQFDHYTTNRNVIIRHDYNDTLRTPKVNPSLYTGIVMNLFTNAVKAVLDVPSDRSEGRGRIIRFSAKNTEDWHILRVADTGSGIPQGMEERIFDPLFSTTESPDDDPLGSGVGLGLYVVKNVVEQSGGEIEVVSPPEGFNTCFEVRYPI